MASTTQPMIPSPTEENSQTEKEQCNCINDSIPQDSEPIY